MEYRASKCWTLSGLVGVTMFYLSTLPCWKCASGILACQYSAERRLYSQATGIRMSRQHKITIEGRMNDAVLLQCCISSLFWLHSAYALIKHCSRVVQAVRIKDYATQERCKIFVTLKHHQSSSAYHCLKASCNKKTGNIANYSFYWRCLTLHERCR